MPFEIQFIKLLQKASSTILDFLAELITFFGEQYVVIFVLAFIYFVYNKKLGEKIAFTLFLSLGLNNSLKGLVKAPRPFTVDPEIIGMRQSTATGFSFPSGHTQVSAAFYTSIAKHLKNKKFWIFTGILIFLVGISRIYLGVHFPKDVIVAIILGIAIAFLGSNLYDLYGKTYKSKQIMFAITAILLLPFVFIFYKSDYNEILPFRDFYTNYALFLGFFAATLVENKYVDFDCNKPLKTKLIRYLIAIVLFVTIQFGLKLVLPENNIYLDMFRYFLVTFIPMGIYPLFFKKLNL